jgi:hypothetical protein
MPPQTTVLLLAALASCHAEPSGPVSLPLADAASIRLFVLPTNSDWTFHIPLTSGHSVRMKVKLYTAAGREITPLPHPVGMTFQFAPATLATASVADSALLLFDLAPADPPGTQGGLSITLMEPSTATTKSFGPFDVLVHADVLAHP